MIKTLKLKASTQVLLLALADDMDAAGRVSVPQAAFAARVVRSVRRVQAALAEAVDAGFLDHLVRGGNGRTAVYCAAFPAKTSESCPRGSSAQLGGLSPPLGADNSGPVLASCPPPAVRTTPGRTNKESRARGSYNGTSTKTVRQGERLDGRRKVVNDVRDELAKQTGKSYPLEWCSKVVDQIFVRGHADKPAAYVRTAIARDLAGPRRFIPTPEPPKYSAAGGFST